MTNLKNSRAAELAVLAFACALPTVVTLAYFVWAEGSAVGAQQAIFGVAKLVQFALPVVWAGAICRERLAWPRWSPRGMLLGAIFGVAVAAALWAMYVTLLGAPVLDDALGPIRAKITSLGVDSRGGFLALGAFYAVCHSLLEEYYWRWFVFGRLARHVALGWAIGISAVAFAAHHVVVLWAYFSHAPTMALLLAACVAVGGACWAWLYHHARSIYAPWFSHLIVDAAIFTVGYHLARPLFQIE